jgi:hypothetical protein
LTELGERAADLSPVDVRRLLLRISSVLIAVAARTADPVPGDTNTDDAPGEDRLLTVEEAASRLSVQPRWLHKNQHRLPFTKKLSRKALRFSEKGLQRWLERGRPAPRTWGKQP